MEKIILARHQLSGYNLNYPQKNEYERLKDRLLGREDQQEEFFRVLYQRSGGDLEEAFLQWLSAFEHIDEAEGSITLSERSHSIIMHLERLPVEQLLMLRQILIHGWMDISIAQDWFCSSVEEVRAHTNALENRSWIKAKKQFWILNPVIRYSLCSLLKQRGWL